MRNAKEACSSEEELLRRPVVGVTVSLDPGKRWRKGSDYWYLNRRYTRSVLAAGLVPILLSPDTPVEAALQLCDALVLSGGGDLPERLPALNPLGVVSETSEDPLETAEVPIRIDWERRLLQAFSEAQRPVLGICFGMQLMNLHFGGSLHVSLLSQSTEKPAVSHGQDRSPSFHPIKICPNTEFLKTWKPPPKVSSAHRQAVAELAPGFRAMAHTRDGLIEAMERGSLIGIEWHPESDASAADIYGRFAALIRPTTSAPIE